MEQNNMTFLLAMISKIVEADKKRKEDKLKRGECFNVFNVLHIESNEVRLHSSLIAELLNPNGSHGMGNVFLKEFLKLLELPVDYFINSINDDIVERYIGGKTEESGGRIDIIMEDGENAIVIENKIYANDQENQLLRYFNYLGKFKRGTLLYLKLDGDEPAEISTNSQNVEYTCISYKHHILPWILKCAELAYDKPMLRETLSQYSIIIKQLTGNNMEKEKENVNSIVEIAVDNLESAVALIESSEAIGKYLREKYIYEPLKEFANEKGLKMNVDIRCIIDFTHSSWNKYRIAITSDNRALNNIYIGITRKDCTQVKETETKLDCLNCEPNTWWPFGSEFLKHGNWTSPNTFIAIKNGDVEKWIEQKITNMLAEIEEKSIAL